MLYRPPDESAKLIDLMDNTTTRNKIVSEHGNRADDFPYVLVYPEVDVGDVRPRYKTMS